MKITINGSRSAYKKTGMLCIFTAEGLQSKTQDLIDSSIEGMSGAAIFPDSQQPANGLGRYGEALKKAIRSEPEAGKISVINTLGIMPADRILLAGLDMESGDSVRIMAGRAARKALDLSLPDFAVVVPEGVPDTIQQIVEGAKLSLYEFDRFKSKKQPAHPDLSILAAESLENAAALRASEAVADGVILTRDIANMPPNECAPATLADLGSTIAAKGGMKFEVFTKSRLKEEGFGGISAVGQGSKNEPRLIILEYRGAGDQKPTVIVGKAVTFDTGGISIKPGAKMDEMKFDKCGGCTVLGIMQAASELKLPVNLVGIIPSVENMPGSESYRPGDIIRLYSKKTAEIINTDAEGRLILADALAYGEARYAPKAIIDFATLTGACIVALGNDVAGMISSDDRLAEGMLRSSARTSEGVWRLPLNDDYMDMIKSDVADMKNLGTARAAGTITAAAFLRNAIKETPWVHFDIAGVAWRQSATKRRSYNPKGATGFGVRLILDYLDQ